MVIANLLVLSFGFYYIFLTSKFAIKNSNLQQTVKSEILINNSFSKPKTNNNIEQEKSRIINNSKEIKKSDLIEILNNKSGFSKNKIKIINKIGIIDSNFYSSTKTMNNNIFQLNKSLNLDNNSHKINQDNDVLNFYIQDYKIKKNLIKFSLNPIVEEENIIELDFDPLYYSIINKNINSNTIVFKPNLGINLYQLNPYKFSNQSKFITLLKNINLGIDMDIHLRNKNYISLHFSHSKLPSKIEFALLDSLRLNKELSVKVINSNHLVYGINYFILNKRKTMYYSAGAQIANSLNKLTYIKTERNNNSYFENEKLPDEFGKNNLRKINTMINFGVHIPIKKSLISVEYFQGLNDYSINSNLFNPISYVKLSYSFQLYKIQL